MRAKEILRVRASAVGAVCDDWQQIATRVSLDGKQRHVLEDAQVIGRGRAYRGGFYGRSVPQILLQPKW